MRKWWWTSGFGVPPVLDNVAFYSSVSGSTVGLSMKVSPVISHLLSLSPFFDRTTLRRALRHHGGSTGPLSTPLWSKNLKIYDRNPQKSTAVWCDWNMLKFKPPSGSLISSHRATELGQTACRLLGRRCSLQPHHCSQRPVPKSFSQVFVWESGRYLTIARLRTWWLCRAEHGIIIKYTVYVYIYMFGSRCICVYVISLLKTWVT